MYFKKANLFKFILILGVVFSGIVVLILIMGNKEAIVLKRSTISQAKSINSDVAVASHINQQPFDNMTSNQKKDDAGMRNIEKAQSRLSRKIVTLESKVDELSEDLRSAVSSELNGNTDQDSGAEEDRDMTEIKAQLDSMEEKLQSEPIDAEWSDLAIMALYDSVKENTSGVFKIINADCRSSLCRLDLMYENDHSNQSIMELSNLVPWDSEIFFYSESMDSDEVVVYVARENYSLPRRSK